MTAVATPPSAESLATSLLATLVERLGTEVVAELVDIATGASEAEAIEDVSLVAMSVIRGALGVLEPAAVKAAVTAGYLAADAQADALEDAKFPKT